MYDMNKEIKIAYNLAKIDGLKLQALFSDMCRVDGHAAGSKDCVSCKAYNLMKKGK